MDEASPKKVIIDRFLKAKIPSPDVSDTLWNMGYDLAVSGKMMSPLMDSYTVGPVITMLYLPQRRNPQYAENKLNHALGFKTARPGHIAVMVGDHEGQVSILGGNAVKMAKECGIVACLVDGGVRDVDEILGLGVAVWTRGVTPKTGRYWLELNQLNSPVAFCGIQVRPGDVAVADKNGICFIPDEALEEVVKKVL